MRLLVTVLALSMLTACTALVVGGSSGGYQNRGDQRDQSISAADSALIVKIRNNFAADSMLGQLNIGIRSNSGTVTLTGSVNDYVARDRAGKVARETAGVVAVNNQVLVAQ
jgi:osmotically-inducible protein OsmY